MLLLCVCVAVRWDRLKWRRKLSAAIIKFFDCCGAYFVSSIWLHKTFQGVQFCREPGPVVAYIWSHLSTLNVFYLCNRRNAIGSTSAWWLTDCFSTSSQPPVSAVPSASSCTPPLSTMQGCIWTSWTWTARASINQAVDDHGEKASDVKTSRRRTPDAVLGPETNFLPRRDNSVCWAIRQAFFPPPGSWDTW